MSPSFIGGRVEVDREKTFIIERHAARERGVTRAVLSKSVVISEK